MVELIVRFLAEADVGSGVRRALVRRAGRDGSDLPITTLRSIYRQAGLEGSGRKR